MTANSQVTVLQIIAVKKPNNGIGQYIENAFGVHTSLTSPEPGGNPNFNGVVWSVTMDQFLIDVNALDQSQSGLHLKPPTSTTSIRNGFKKTVAKDLKLILSDVQKVADLTPANAIVIIESADLAVKQSSAHTKFVGARNTNVSGTIVIAAAESGHHEWAQKNADGSWLALRSGTSAKKTVTGLTPGSSQIFRSAPILATEDGAWTIYAPIIIT